MLYRYSLLQCHKLNTLFCFLKFKPTKKCATKNDPVQKCFSYLSDTKLCNKISEGKSIESQIVSSYCRRCIFRGHKYFLKLVYSKLEKMCTTRYDAGVVLIANFFVNIAFFMCRMHLSHITVIIHRTLIEQVMANWWLPRHWTIDVIDHDLLLWKSALYGLSNDTLHLISPFLSNQEQLVCINTIKSDFLPVKYGIPQGFSIRPASLFSLHKRFAFIHKSSVWTICWWHHYPF